MFPAASNPAVTIGFRLSGRFPARRVVPYILSQLLGAFAASACCAAFSETSHCWEPLCRRQRGANIRLGVRAHAVDVCNPMRLERPQRSWRNGGNRGRRRHRTGSALRRPNLRSINEPRSLPRAGCFVRSSHLCLDLPHRPLCRLRRRCPLLENDAQTTENSIAVAPLTAPEYPAAAHSSH